MRDVECDWNDDMFVDVNYLMSTHCHDIWCDNKVDGN